jgi:calcium-dependent protein kinase
MIYQLNKLMGNCCEEPKRYDNDDKKPKENGLVNRDKFPKQDENQGNVIRKAKNSSVRIVENKEDIKISPEMLCDNIGIDPLDNYVILTTIDKTQYGSFYLVKHKDSNLKRMMKQFHLTTDKIKEETVQKLSVFKHLDHPMILKFYEIYYYHGKIYVLSEFFEKGGLDAIIKQKNVLKERQTAIIIYNLLLGLNYAHKHNIIHGYLNPENILIEGIDNEGSYNIRIKEFGVIINQVPYKIDKELSNINYMSPEVLLDQPFDISCDLWSIGIIAYELLEGRRPFEGKSFEDTEKNIFNFHDKLNVDKLGKCSSLGKEFIKNLIVRDPSKRLKVEEALNHKWFIKFSLKERNTVIEQTKLDDFMNKMISFDSDFKLQKICIALIVHNLPPDNDIKMMEKAFTSMDKNLDGYLNRRELLSGLKNIFKENNKIDFEKLLDRIFKNVDYDKSGNISYEEFVCACIDKSILLKEEYLKYTFSSFDADGSGYITCKEIQDVLSGKGQNQISKEVCEEILREVDIKKRGKILFEEFRIMMEKILD